jgi:maltose alpha-D-glucosyltransferase/alpha-amylase
MFSGDERRLKMANSLMFALPGSPVIWYGEEIGMGDDLSQPERASVRTPMQWSDRKNAGFSEAPAKRLVRPVVSTGKFGYRKVNVAAQRDVPGSMMEHMQRLIRTRRSCPEVGWGTCEVLETGEASVLAFAHAWQGQTVVTLHNLADREVMARLPADAAPPELTPLLSSDGDRKRRSMGEPVRLEPYGFCWFRADGERR